MDKIDLDAIINNFKNTSRIEEPYTNSDFKKCMKEAIHQALVLASENAVAKENPADYGSGDIWVDKQSILDVEKLIV